MCDTVKKIRTETTRFLTDNYLKDYLQIASDLIDYLTNTKEINLSRGKIDIWSGAIIVVIARVNFLFDKNRSNSIELNDICVFFNTKKTSIGNKASKISELLNIGLGDRRFSDPEVFDSFKDVSENAKKSMATASKSLFGARNRALLYDMVGLLKR